MDNRKRVRQVAGHMICVLIAAAFTFGAALNTGRIQKEELQSFYYYDYEMPDETTTVYDKSVSEEKNIAKIGKGEGIKKQMLFMGFRKGKERKFHSVIILLEESFPFDTECTFYYQNRKMKLETKLHTTVDLPEGETTVFLPLPEDVDYEMNGFRVDFGGEYHLDKVLISEDELKTVYDPGKIPEVKAYIICFLAILFLAECTRFFKEEIRALFTNLYRKRKIAVIIIALIGIITVNGMLIADIVFRITGEECSSFWKIFFAITALVVILELFLLLRKRKDSRRRKPVALENEYSNAPSFIRKGIYWLLAALILFRVILAFHDSIKGISEELDSAHVIIPFIVISGQVILLSMLFRKYFLFRDNDRIEYRTAYLFIFFLTGLTYMLLFLPYVSPDEPDHFMSAYRVSDILLGQIGQLGNKRLLMRMEDYLFFKQRNHVLTPEYYMKVSDNLHVFAGTSGYAVVNGPMVTNSIFSYFPTGMGIALARALHLSAGLTFYFGRFGNLIFFTVVLWHLMKRIPFESTAVFTMAMFPMMLHIVGSYSYDVVTFCFTALFVTQILVIVYERDKADNRDLALCTFYGMLMAPSKLVYLPLVLLVFLIPGKKIANSSKDSFKTKSLIVAAAIVSVIFVMTAVSMLGAESAIREMVKDNGTVNMIAWAQEEGYTIKWVLSHPLKYLIMCIRTLFMMADSYFFTMIGSRLGWYNIGVHNVTITFCFIAFLLAINMRRPDSETIEIDWKSRSVIAISCFASAMMTLLSMALNWTPLSYNYISGVQGRYFLPLLIPAIWMSQNPYVYVSDKLRKHILFFEGAINILVIVHIFTNTMV